MQSTGQNGTHAEHPVQLSSSTTAIRRGRVFFALILSGSSGTDFKWSIDPIYSVTPKILKCIFQ